MFKNLNEKHRKKLYSVLSIAVICAIVAILLPSLSSDKESITTKKEQDNNEVDLSEVAEQQNLEKKLKTILSQIEGVGDLDVMITFESSEEIQPAYNLNSTTEKTQEKDAQGGERTVTTSSENKTMITSSSNNPIIIKTTEPKIKGVLVVASGASDSNVKESLYNAVQVALQISGHQVEIYNK